MKPLMHYWNLTFTDWRYRFATHVLFWFFLLFFWMRESVVIHIDFQQDIWPTLTGIMLSLLLFYPLVYGVIPLLRRHRFLAATVFFVLYYLAAITLRTYHISLLVSMNDGKSAWYAGQDFWDNIWRVQLSSDGLPTRFFSSISSLLGVVMIPLGIKFFRYAYRFNHNLSRMEKEKAKMELDFLKGQLNPHLFFNTLNNLQSFIIHDEKSKSVNLINHLSAFMRYSLYESRQELIPLANELTLIEDYIAIERVRYEGNAVILMDFQKPDKAIMIPPLLFMPMVENAFKHGSGLNSGEVDIRIHCKVYGNNVSFSVSNTYRYFDSTDLEKTGGIGMNTLRRRLAYYYPASRHQLVVKDTGDNYFVELTIQVVLSKI